MKTTVILLALFLLPLTAVLKFGQEPFHYVPAAAGLAAQWLQPIRQPLLSDPLRVEQMAKKTAARKKTTTRKATGRGAGRLRGQYPEASERLLAEKDVRFLSPWGKTVMINEIYARHGLVFTDRALRNHFRKERWYRGKYRNVDKMLTDTERKNIDYIRQYQPKS